LKVKKFYGLCDNPPKSKRTRERLAEAEAKIFKTMGKRGLKELSSRYSIVYIFAKEVD
jgi:hypothetical protein